jgi:UDP-N-acetylglucosamine diphosphorylase / glucose-1-phosphate thymidylyltransferase / UDP-N-acetylgalactosamine diphosphorylase / glucosamine-1-phosphate N-acetyltransferase / galactosamine-1-phosphate N-acetyltransferase
VGRHANIYPTSSVRGVIPENSIYKDKDDIVQRK